MPGFIIKNGELRPFPALLIILSGLLAAYWQVHDFAFVGFDDAEYIVNNPVVNNGLSWAAVKWSFTAFYAANWHPLAWISHMVDVSAFGLKSGSHHLASVAWHLANVSLLFFLLNRCWRGGLWRSILVTVLFAWHPLRVESVAWIAERKDLLCAFFWLLTLILYTFYAKRMSWQYYLLTLFSAACALMAKPMAVTLPFLLFLLDYWPLQRYPKTGIKRLVLEKIPFFILILFSAILTFMAQRQAGAVSSAAELGIGPRVVNALVAYGEYVKLQFWPQNLAVLYRYRIDYSWLRIVISGIGFCGIFYFVFRERKRYPFLLVGWCWFVGTLVPVIGLVQVGGQAWADRYTYIPAIGFWLALVWFGAAVSPARSRRWVTGAVIAAAFFYLILSWQQTHYWHDTVTLFQRAVKMDKNNPVAYNLLGQALAKEKRWSETEPIFSRAMQLNSRFGQALLNWGNALQEQGRNQEAEEVYRKAMQPEIREIDAFVAFALMRKKEHRLDDAEKILRQALSFAPASSAVNYNLATILLHKGQTEESVPLFNKALKLRPYHVKTHINLGIALAHQGQLTAASRQLSYALQLDPGNKQAQYNLMQLKRLQAKKVGSGG